MTKKDLPNNTEWDVFWGDERAEQFTKISWSKKRIINILNEFLRKNKNVLDAGCGSGFFSKYFCDQGMNTVSLDYSDKALEIANKITDGKTKILKTDLLLNVLSDEVDARFDVIFTDGLFEHFSDVQQDAIISNFKSVLKDDGVIVTFVPNMLSPWQLIRPFYMPSIKEKPFYLNQLVDLNVRNGLVVRRSGGINVLPFKLSFDSLLGKYFGMLLYSISGKNLSV